MLVDKLGNRWNASRTIFLIISGTWRPGVDSSPYAFSLVVDSSSLVVDSSPYTFAFFLLFFSFLRRHAVDAQVFDAARRRRGGVRGAGLVGPRGRLDRPLCAVAGRPHCGAQLDLELVVSLLLASVSRQRLVAALEQTGRLVVGWVGV